MRFMKLREYEEFRSGMLAAFQAMRQDGIAPTPELKRYRNDRIRRLNDAIRRAKAGRGRISDN